MPPNETTPLLASDSEVGGISRYDDNQGAAAQSVAKNGAITNGRSDEQVGQQPQAQDPDVPTIPGVDLRFIVPAMAVGIFLAAMDNTIVVASYGRIGTDMKELNRTSWISTAYLLTTTSFQALYGRLSDIFGRKACLLFSYVVFGIGCVFCGLARNMNELVGARAFAGIGGGGMATVTSILLSDIVPLRTRGTWQGILNIIFAIGSATGGPLGGYLADTVGWRWAFLGQVPMALLAILVVSTALHLPPTPVKFTETDEQSTSVRARLRRVDFPGALTLVTATFVFLLSMDLSTNSGIYTLTSPFTLSLLAASVILYSIFYYIEASFSAEPFCPPDVVKRREILSPCIANFCSFGSFMVVIFHLPLYYQAVLGASAAQAGQRLIPAILGGVTGSLAGGIYMQKTGNYYWITVLSYFLLFLGTIIMTLATGISELSISVNNRVSLMHLAILTMGFGNGVGVTSTLIALISNVSSAEQAVVTALSYLFRSLGSVLGLSISAGLVQSGLKRRLFEKLGDGEAVEQIIKRVREDLDYIGHLDPDVALVVRKCYKGAVAQTMGFAVALACGAWLASWWMREVRVKK